LRKIFSFPPPTFNFPNLSLVPRILQSHGVPHCDFYSWRFFLSAPISSSLFFCSDSPHRRIGLRFSSFSDSSSPIFHCTVTLISSVSHLSSFLQGRYSALLCTLTIDSYSPPAQRNSGRLKRFWRSSPLSDTNGENASLPTQFHLLR